MQKQNYFLKKHYFNVQKKRNQLFLFIEFQMFMENGLKKTIIQFLQHLLTIFQDLKKLKFLIPLIK